MQDAIGWFRLDGGRLLEEIFFFHFPSIDVERGKIKDYEGRIYGARQVVTVVRH